MKIVIAKPKYQKAEIPDYDKLIQALETEIEEAVAREDYERAAKAKREKERFERIRDDL